MNKQPPKKIRTNQRIGDKQLSLLDIQHNVVDYILLSEHEKERNKDAKWWDNIVKNKEKQLVEKNAEIDKLRIERQSKYDEIAELKKQMNTYCGQHENERQDLKKVIDHWKSSYNQAADERNEAKKMLLTMAKRLPVPKNVKFVKVIRGLKRT
jgi:seryl-tRNA synthetase